MSGKVACPRCGCAEIDKDAATGGAYCTNCGSVLEENAIVAEVEFFETGGGGHGALGQFVSADAPSKLRIGSLPGVTAKESREVTLQRAKRLINELASQLGGLNQHCKDTALNFVSMAIRGGLTRGRRSTHVIAACLYITSRLEGTPHLLLDFSDVLQVNVYELGKVYNFMARKLLIRLPNIDPCDYIMRFAHCLNFGDKEHDVAMIALRLVQRMKRDWMAFGRRPTGLCGAALLLAARFHNFNRTVNDVVKIVNISETVIRKRLDEFAHTPSSELTLDEFTRVDLEQTSDPPAFQEARHKAKRTQQQQTQQHQPQLTEDIDWSGSRLKALEKELLATEAALDAALSERAASRRHPYAKFAKDDNGKRPDSTLSGGLGVDNDDGDLEHQLATEFVEEQLLAEIIPREGESSSSAAAGADAEEQTPAQRFGALRPTLATLGITTSLVGAETTSSSETAEEQRDEQHEDSLQDIDDDEIDSYLLNPDEIKIKEELWMANYEDYVVAMEEKRRLKEEEKQKEEQEGVTKKKKATVRRKRPAQSMEASATANEAIEKIVQEKKLSNKINYEVLKSLTVPDSSKETIATASETKPASVSSLAKSEHISRKPMSRFKPYIFKKS